MTVAAGKGVDRIKTDSMRAAQFRSNQLRDKTPEPSPNIMRTHDGKVIRDQGLLKIDDYLKMAKANPMNTGAQSTLMMSDYISLNDSISTQIKNAVLKLQKPRRRLNMQLKSRIASQEQSMNLSDQSNHEKLESGARASGKDMSPMIRPIKISKQFQTVNSSQMNHDLISSGSISPIAAVSPVRSSVFQTREDLSNVQTLLSNLNLIQEKRIACLKLCQLNDLEALTQAIQDHHNVIQMIDSDIKLQLSHLKIKNCDASYEFELKDDLLTQPGTKPQPQYVFQKFLHMRTLPKVQETCSEKSKSVTKGESLYHQYCSEASLKKKYKVESMRNQIISQASSIDDSPHN